MLLLQQGVVDISEVTQSTAKKTPVPVSRRDHMAQITATQAVNFMDKQSAPMPMKLKLNTYLSTILALPLSHS